MINEGFDPFGISKRKKENQRVRREGELNTFRQRKQENEEKFKIRSSDIEKALPSNIKKLIEDILSEKVKIISSLAGKSGGCLDSIKYSFILSSGEKVKIVRESADQYPEYVIDIHDCFLFLNNERYVISSKMFFSIEDKIEEYLISTYGKDFGDDD